MRRSLVLLAVAVCVAAAFAGPAEAQTTRPAAAGGPVARAVIISGLGGSKTYSRLLLDWTGRFAKLLTARCGLKEENIIVLTEDGDAPGAPAATTQATAPASRPGGGPRPQKATLENLKAAMRQMTGRLGPDDQFILVMAGHGQINEPVGKLCLPGPDLKADELAAMLDELPTGKVVIINAASGGAEFVKTCAAIGRVILTGAGAEDDGNQTYFAEFFLRAWETGQADKNNDKIVDLMEAYSYAARETANFYHRQYLVTDGTLRGARGPLVWYVRGKETRAVWRKLYADTDNRLGMPRRAPTDEPLPDPETEPDKEPRFGPFGPNWHNRRVLPEHARLDDNAGKRGFYLWQPYEFVKLPEDEPGATGYLARRTALGRTDPLAGPTPPTTREASR